MCYNISSRHVSAKGRKKMGETKTRSIKSVFSDAIFSPHGGAKIESASGGKKSKKANSPKKSY
jgi:hypothetical protein